MLVFLERVSYLKVSWPGQPQELRFIKAPVSLTEGCPSGASGPLGRVVVSNMKTEQATLRLPVCFQSGKRDSSPRLRLGLSRAFNVTPAFLAEGCPSGASGSLVRAGVSNMKPEQATLRLPVCFQSGKRDSNSRPRPWQGRALPTELFPRWVAKVGNFSFSANFFSKKGFCPCHACTRAFPCPFHSLCFLPFDGAYGLLWHDWHPGVFPFAMLFTMCRRCYGPYQ